MSKSIVKTLLEKGNEELNLGDSKGELTPLMWACKLCRLELVKLLLDQNIDVNAKSRNGDTAFIIACSSTQKDLVERVLKESRQKDLVVLLLNNNQIDLNATNNAGETGFIKACKTGNKDVVKLLLLLKNSHEVDVTVPFSNAYSQEIQDLLFNFNQVPPSPTHNSEFLGMMNNSSDNSSADTYIFLTRCRIKKDL